MGLIYTCSLPSLTSMGLKLPEMLWHLGFSSTNLQVVLELNVRFFYGKFLLNTSSDVHFFFLLQFLFVIINWFGAMLNIVPSELRQRLSDAK